MKALLTIGELVLIALHACSLCNADEPADLTPLYAAMESPVATASEPASLSALYELCEVTDCTCGKDCDCEGCDACPCGEMPLERKLAKKVEVLTSRLATLQAKLDEPDEPDVDAITDRFEQLLARIESTRPLPSDDPPPRPDAVENPPAKAAEPSAMVPFANEAPAMLVLEVAEKPAEFQAELKTAGCPDWVVDLYKASPGLTARMVHGYRLKRSAENSKLPQTDRNYFTAQFKMLSVKNPAVQPQSAKVYEYRTRGYPVRANWWNHPGSDDGHLMSGQHAGKFPKWWIDSLSHAERESLHADDHEGQVKWDYVPKQTQAKTGDLMRRVPVYERRTVCDGNGCRTVTVQVGWRDAPL